MNKLKLFLLVKILFLTIMFSSVADSATPHANDLILKFEGLGEKHLRLLNVTFTVSGHEETQPQTFESISTQIMEGNKAKITVNVGRKASNHVAEVFTRWVSADYRPGPNGWTIPEYRPVFGHYPKSLNFAVMGDLAFKVMNQSGQIKEYVYRDFVIAQGHSGWGANNWWMASRRCNWMGLRGLSDYPSKGKGDNSIICDPGGMPTQFLRQRIHLNHINVILR